MGAVRIGNKTYNPEKSILVCKSPQGILYRKKSGSTEFYIHNPEGNTNAEKFKSVTWSEASNIVKTYGTREQWIKEFTAMDKSTNSKDGGSTQIRLDSYHRIKAMRNADRLGLGLTEYIKRLIDRDDNNRNY